MIICQTPVNAAIRASFTRRKRTLKIVKGNFEVQTLQCFLEAEFKRYANTSCITNSFQNGHCPEYHKSWEVSQTLLKLREPLYKNPLDGQWYGQVQWCEK